MLSNRKYNMLLSLIIAVCLWGYVINDTGTTDTRTFRNIPITFVNEDVLANKGLAISETSVDGINVTVRGSRTNLNRIAEGDISAIVDVSSAEKGNNQIKVIVQTPSNVEYKDSSVNKINVYVEKLITKKVKVDIKYDGDAEKNREAIVLSQSPESVIISGASSRVNKVKGVIGTLDLTKVTSEAKIFGAELVPVDKLGNKVSNIKMSSGRMAIKAQLANVKTVPLKITVKNRDADLVGRTYSVPEEVEIKGSSETLAKIDHINAQSVDISDVTSNTKIQVKPILPSGVSLTENSESMLFISVNVEGEASKTFALSKDDLEITGNDRDEENVNIEETSFNITVTGKKKDIAKIKKENLKISIDLEGLDVGEHTVKVNCTCEGAHRSITFAPKTVKVIITE